VIPKAGGNRVYYAPDSDTVRMPAFDIGLLTDLAFKLSHLSFFRFPSAFAGKLKVGRS